MTDLNTLLDQNTAPSVRSSLSARILTAADAAQPANDIASRRTWWSAGGMAAMTAIAALFFFQSVSEPTADWEQIADGSGFTELYDWVEGEDS